MRSYPIDRRSFLQWTSLAAGAPLLSALSQAATPQTDKAVSGARQSAKVAVARCRTYGPEMYDAMARCFDQLGGLGHLVGGKTVTVKLNLTGTNFLPLFGRPVGESYMTHPETARALTQCLFRAGAKRVRLVESTNSRAALPTTLDLADWDLRSFEQLGRVEFENTRNLGQGDQYAHLNVPGRGYLFSSFDLNHSYADTDVLVSLAKLKDHVTAGVTLSMKNCFGITPNTLYGSQAGSENATAGRGPLHQETGYERIQLPGWIGKETPADPGFRVPRIVADLCAARPIDLAIIDGITSMKGGEGPWCGPVSFTTPGVLIAGLNPVSTDAVGTAVIGYDPRATRGQRPFQNCDNHLLLAESRGVGTADLKQIEILGESLESVRYPYGA